ncbi:DUF2721 domain-containing protein [Rosettibacter firmus]|uniref:DUF2721 domain-containing protein n=1 Tax=Rosettibacter firmus TaxID=3111522 RepID=UPI00336C1907
MENLFSIKAVNIIQLMLAPAVMISACGLLLLSLNNRYSLLANRIRLLNEEKRRLLLKAGEKALDTEENVRLASIAKQIEALVYRLKLVRNAVLYLVSAVSLFVLTSILLGLSSIFVVQKMDTFIIATFLVGMLLVFIGVFFAGFESKKGFDIIKFEVISHE